MDSLLYLQIQSCPRRGDTKKKKKHILKCKQGNTKKETERKFQLFSSFTQNDYNKLVNVNLNEGAVIVSRIYAHLSYHPTEACSCWQCVWIHVLFRRCAFPSHHSDRGGRCAVDSQARTASTSLNPHARTRMHTQTLLYIPIQWDIVQPSLFKTQLQTLARTHTHTHSQICSVFIRSAAEGYERTQQLLQITDKLNSSHSLTDGKWSDDWHPKYDNYTQGYL